jgi:hypothetical protein
LFFKRAPLEYHTEHVTRQCNIPLSIARLSLNRFCPCCHCVRDDDRHSVLLLSLSLDEDETDLGCDGGAKRESSGPAVRGFRKRSQRTRGTTLVHRRRRPSKEGSNVAADLDPVRCGRELWGRRGRQWRRGHKEQRRNGALEERKGNDGLRALTKATLFTLASWRCPCSGW